jgi:hypothetical protein
MRCLRLTPLEMILMSFLRVDFFEDDHTQNGRDDHRGQEDADPVSAKVGHVSLLHQVVYSSPMKVIQKGPVRKPYQFTCKGCKSVLEVEAEDGRLVSDPRDGAAYVFKCPVCQIENWINAALVEGTLSIS